MIQDSVELVCNLLKLFRVLQTWRHTSRGYLAIQFFSPNPTLGHNFQIWTNLQRSGMPWYFVHNFAPNYCMKLVEGSFKVDFNSLHDREKKIPKTIIFKVATLISHLGKFVEI